MNRKAPGLCKEEDVAVMMGFSTVWRMQEKFVRNKVKDHVDYLGSL